MGRAMNYREALNRAREIWGEVGAAEVRHWAPKEERRVVGTKGAPPESAAYGRGAPSRRPSRPPATKREALLHDRRALR